MLTPEKILLRIADGTLDKTKAVELLVLQAESSNDDTLRVKSVHTLGNINLKNRDIFKILENFLISDKNPYIRGAAAKVIVQKFPKKCVKPLNWVIQNEISVITLKNIYEIIEENEYQQFKNLTRDLHNRLSEIFNVVPEEIFFLLEIFYILARTKFHFNKDHSPIYDEWGDLIVDQTFINEISSNKISYFPGRNVDIGRPLIYVVVLSHIRALNLSGWGLKELPESIGSLTKLRYLNLEKNKLTQLPNSLFSLKYLRKLYLDDNKLKSLPDSFENLIYLKKLYLTNNFKLKSVPNSVFVTTARNIAKKYIKEGVNKIEAPVLGLFEILTGDNLEKVNDTNKGCIYEPGAQFYDVDEAGHVVGIYLVPYHYLFEIHFIPEQIHLLKFLKERYISFTGRRYG